MKTEIKGTPFEIMESISKQIVGLMFRSQIVPLIFVFPCSSSHPIHSFFVFQSFEAVYLDDRFNVTDIFVVHPFSPWIEAFKPSKYLLEVPLGWSDAHDIKLNKKIEFNFDSKK